ncbi:MAG TPA: tRNA (adenosine(37)-N6)-threonylcarbamoyltransferase complex ATPase subunit type 1 TsaE [Steroidobacteraceae bacterium]|nr:tRNA (adenosine(37)-N6)-threonylcarbamoyltransferase complex ATPase subunit type 1 TsaE [Steroidobacteraceae bacterium]
MSGPVGAWVLADADATRRLGESLGRHCPWAGEGPRCLFLTGELGAGKTTLAAGLLAAVGVSEPVRSPSYALIEIYGVGSRLAVHVDLYRLRGAAELEQLGLRDYLQPETLLVIEWPEHGAGALPQPDLWLRLQIATGRLCHPQALSPAGEAWLAAVRRELPLSGIS